MADRQLIGMAGAACLAVGVFAPAFSAPIVGNVNLFRNGEGDGLYLFVASVIALVLVALGSRWWLSILAGGCAVVIGFDLADLIMRMRGLKSDLAEIGGVGSLAAQSIQIQWAWLLLIAGVVLLMLSAGLDDDEQYAAHERPPRDENRDSAAEGYLPIEDFAAQTGTTPAKALAAIKAGELVGRFSGTRWEVHRSELPSTRLSERE